MQATDADRAVVEHLDARLGEQLLVRTATAPTDRAVLAATIRRAGRVEFVVGIDAVQGLIGVRRRVDGTVLLRDITAEAFRESPYSAALAAFELIELARGAPVVVSKPRPPPPPPPSSSGGSVEGKNVAVSSTSAFALRVEIGGTATWSAGNEVTLLRPALALGGDFDFEPLSFRLDARMSAFGRRSATVQSVRIDYRRHDLGLGLGIGTVLGSYRLGGSVRIGSSYVSIDLEGSAETDRRFVPWYGLAVDVDRALGAGFGVAAHLDVRWVPQPPRFLVLEQPVLFERGLRLGFTLAVSWGTY